MRLTPPIVLAALACACTPDAPTDRLRVSGHVEATEIRVAATSGGRVLTLAAHEGDRVAEGQPILTLDASDAELALRRARADAAQADAQLRLLQAGPRPEDIRQADAQVDAARADAAAARAELASAEQDLERFESLLRSNSGSRKQRDDAATRRDVSRERLASAESRIQAAQEGLLRIRAGSRREEIDAARARVGAAAAQIATIDKRIADTRLISPAAGVVTQKLVEVGEVIAPGAPALVLVDLDHVWADVFVPEPVVPRLTLGQTATVHTDAGGAGVTGTITYVSPKAEFTPRNVQTADERSKLVYRIRIAVDNKAGVLKQGMPVEADLILRPVQP